MIFGKKTVHFWHLDELITDGPINQPTTRTLQESKQSYHPTCALEDSGNNNRKTRHGQDVL